MSKKKNDSPLAMEEVDLLKLERARMHVRAVDSEIIIQQHLRAAYLAKIDPQNVLGAFDEKIQQLKAERQQADDKRAAAMARISEKLKVNLVEYTYDDETGILYKL